MSYSIDFLTDNEKQIGQLASVYHDSYCTLSKSYKIPEEMALYTPSFFLNQINTFKKDTASSLFVLSNGNEPVGFVRYSPAPNAYKNTSLGAVVEEESGKMDGVDYKWNRITEFQDICAPINDKTLNLNQIYLAPSVQHKKEHLGTRLLEATLPLMKDKGYDTLIVEYNINNNAGIRFYQGLDMKQIGTTQALSHILPEPLGKCIADIGISHAPISKIVRACERKMCQNGLSRIPFSKGLTR